MLTMSESGKSVKDLARLKMSMDGMLTVFKLL